MSAAAAAQSAALLARTARIMCAYTDANLVDADALPALIQGCTKRWPVP